MITLGIDTSGKTLSLALAKDRSILAEISLALGYKHSITFQPQVQALLTACDLTLDQVDLFALANGPGSFTGIRIGLAGVKAMAYATGARTMAISSLRALAWSAGPFPGLTAPLLDARGGRVYSSLFDQDQALIQEAPRSIPQLIQALTPFAESGQPILVTGDGIGVLEKEADALGDLPFNFQKAAAHNRFIRASAIIDLALKDLDDGQPTLDPFDLDASYVLASSAERAREPGDDR